MRHEGEPSVEEILESIKKVIARDNREAQQVERSRRESVGVAVPTARPVEEGTALPPLRRNTRCASTGTASVLRSSGST